MQQRGSVRQCTTVGGRCFQAQAPRLRNNPRHGHRQQAWRQQAAAAVERARKQDISQAFAVAGVLPDVPLTAATALQVAGYSGTLQLPLPPHQVEALLSLGEPAAVCPDEQASLHCEVRTAVQIDAAEITASLVWQQQLHVLTERVATELGVEPQLTVKARPHQLQLCTKGVQCKSHHATGKGAGMFGTLVVQLPVVGGHKGGNLMFKHCGKMYRWVTESNSDAMVQYAAAFANVEHEQQLVMDGARAVMVYQLVSVGAGKVPTATEGRPLLQELRYAVTSWEQELAFDTPGTPQVLCVMLSHQYSGDNLSFSALKGSDAKLVGCLNHPESGLDVHLAVLSRTDTYSDGVVDEYGYQSSQFDVEACISGVGTKPCKDVIRHLGLCHKGNSPAAVHPQLLRGGAVPAWADERDNDDGAASHQREPDIVVQRPWTGWGGGTLDHVYQDAVAVIWPKTRAAAALGDCLVSALYLLELRQAQGIKSDIEAAVQQIISLFQRPVDLAVLDKYGGPSYQHLGGQQRITAALKAISDLEPYMAVSALASIIPCLPNVGGASGTLDGNEEEGDTLRAAIVQAVVGHGTPALLVTAVTTLIKTHTIRQLNACALFALRAACSIMPLQAAVADAILSQTLLAADAPQVLAGMHASDVRILAAMLCQLPTHQQHMHALATAVLALPDPQPALEQLMTDPDVCHAANQVPEPLTRLAQARQQHLKKLIKPKPEFTWRMEKASLPGYPDVEAFLHGPEVQATFVFAENWAVMELIDKHFSGTAHMDERRGNISYEMQRAINAQAARCTHTATTAFHGAGRVTITKRRFLYDYQVKMHEAEQKTIKEQLTSAEQLLQLCMDVATKPHPL